MGMELSDRLEALIGAVEPTEAAADIGTDHGFLPIELIRRGICQKMIACDVRSGPLERAKAHVKEAHLEEKIETRLADGLKGLRPGEVKGVVIAGMGGALMASILEKADPEVIEGLDQMILQPQSEFDKVRVQADRMGFAPVKEQMLIDRGKYYWLMVMKKKELHSFEGNAGDACTEYPGDCLWEFPWQKTYGTILPKSQDPILLQYIHRQMDLLEGLYKELETMPSEASGRRRSEIQEELADLRAVIAFGEAERFESERQEEV